MTDTAERARHHSPAGGVPDVCTERQHRLDRFARVADAAPRSGVRLVISPWEYHHLRAWAGVRVASGVVLVGLGAVTLSFGGNDGKTYGWATAFLAAAANLAFAGWELSIARSTTARA
jgi:hypothetical protein